MAALPLFKGDDPSTSKKEFIRVKEAFYSSLQFYKLEHVMNSETLHAPGRYPDREFEPKPTNTFKPYDEAVDGIRSPAQQRAQNNLYFKNEQLIVTKLKHWCDRDKQGEGELSQAYSLLKKLIHDDPCKAKSIIATHASKLPKARLHSTWTEFLFNWDGADVRGLADCMDTLKNATSDHHAVHTRHAIFAATVAYMEERGVAYDKNIVTQYFVDGMKSTELTIAVIIDWQRRVSRHNTQLVTKSKDDTYCMTAPEPKETWADLSQEICNVVTAHPEMDTGPPKEVPAEPETRAFLARPEKGDKSGRSVTIDAAPKDDRPCWVCGIPGHRMDQCTSTHCADCKERLPSDREKHRGSKCSARARAKIPSSKGKRTAPQSGEQGASKKPKTGGTSSSTSMKKKNAELSAQVKALTAVLAAKESTSSSKDN